MNTRRKFLLHSSMTAAALIVSKPFKIFAAGNSSFFMPADGNHLVLLHTAGNGGTVPFDTLKFLSRIKKKTGNALLLDASCGKPSADLQFDASVNDSSVFTGEQYRIVNKGGIKTGLITIANTQNVSLNTISELASSLKKEKGCAVVVCMSQLGYHNAEGPDDKKLAAASRDIDVIIGSNPDNFSRHAMILHNSQKQEVIIQAAAATNAAFGKIELGFDAKGNKNHVHLLNKVPHKQGQQHCIVAA